MKKKLIILFTIFLSFITTGCGSESKLLETTTSAEEPITLSLGHNMNEDHTVHIALMSFIEKVESRTDGMIQFEIYPNSQLGSEPEMLEQLQAGVLDMVKVGSPGMANFNDAYHAFGLPYLFTDENHFYEVMNSPEMKDFFLSSSEDGFVTLTYYTSGQRSFYTIDQPIREPEDLKGMNLRVQEMESQVDMLQAMGGTPVSMDYGDVYTSMQTGMIDGTENNETALTEGQHGELAKKYSYTEHSMIPDVLVMSEQTWNSKIAPEHQDIIIEAAEESTEEHVVMWDEAIQESIEIAENEMDVEFITDVNKEAFMEKTEFIIEDYMDKYDNVKKIVNISDKYE